MFSKGFQCNYMTVISADKVIRNNMIYFLCRCKCGNERYVHYNMLKYGMIQDCGCGSFHLDNTRKEFIGKKFNSLTITDCYYNIKNNKKTMTAKCVCDCGKVKDVPLVELKNGHIKSCGCAKEMNFEKRYKNKIYHGIQVLQLVDKSKRIVSCKCHCGNIFTVPLIQLTKSKRYVIGCQKCNGGKSLLYNVSGAEEMQDGNIRRIFYSMKQRCYNKKSKSYKWYGELGVAICDEWLNNIDSFITWAKENGYKKGLTIDRINGNGNYEPSNCRWVDMVAQNNNKERTRKFLINGDELTLRGISTKYNMNFYTLKNRLYHGMTIEEAISIPVVKGNKNETK